MRNLFAQHIANQFPFLEEKKIFIAVSGGLDSMVLLHLMQELKYSIAILHCNFQLRGQESTEDQEFIRDYAFSHSISFYTTNFNTKAFAKDFQLSVQEAARTLRYQWFYEELDLHQGDCILTAHHADDNLETFFINLSRGTGLQGLTGIPIQNDKVFRPLLPFSRIQIEHYAKENNLKWREDSSNASDNYLRNKIRHHLIPLLKDWHPNYLETFMQTQQHLKEAQNMVEDATIIVYQQVAKAVANQIHFDLSILLKIPNYKAYLYQWLNEFGFTAWEDIYNLVDAQSGKQVFSSEYRILKNRNFLIVSPIDSEISNQTFMIEANQSKVNFPLKLSFTLSDTIDEQGNTVIFVDKDDLQFPLELRHWRQGDVFQPFGMNGKSKKVSKFFKDEKFSLLQKESTWLLCSNNQIVWIIGWRQDERFKIKSTTQNILKISIKE